MPYFRTLLVRTKLLLVATIACSAACSEDEGTSDADSSIDGGDGGANGSGTSGSGTNGSGTNGSGTNGSGTNGSGTSGTNGTGNGGVNGGTNGETCGGFAGTPCPAGFFCNVEEEVGGAGCFTTDGSGVCQEKPSACPGIYEPVCTCDIRSYASSCNAHSQGVSVLHEGLCTAEECQSVGGRPEYSDGASTPMCKSGETVFDIAGRESGLCCVPK